MEGWNDCPEILPTPLSSRSSSVSSRPKRRAQRISSMAKASEAYSQAPQPSAMSQEQQNNSCSDEILDLKDLRELVERVLSDNEASEEDKNVIRSSLIDKYNSLDINHKALATSTMKALQSGGKASEIKSKIVVYMMSNPGAASWAVGLRKLVDLSNGK